MDTHQLHQGAPIPHSKAKLVTIGNLSVYVQFGFLEEEREPMAFLLLTQLDTAKGRKLGLEMFGKV